ncbi:MAG: type II toxin-antitoxin system RelE/ParE family toxin [Spirochaetia bacterium]|nr:type II toxin-antitoxin system RelE/ParE family toxin [Spirochaetia bacterium]
MTREFVMMPEFDRQWQKMGLGDEELRQLQETLLRNPKAGSVMRGTGGLRKIRMAFEGRGKSGSGRVAYVDFTLHETIYLITAYPKNAKDNLSESERNEIAKRLIALRKGIEAAHESASRLETKLETR